MKELLQQPADRGYPAEYLLTRIRGRRSRLIADWKQLVFEGAVQEYLASSRYQGFVRERTPEALWRNLMREYRWVYTQMNEQLRKQFRPFFLYAELRTLSLCLRRLRDKDPGTGGELLELSLLSSEIKRILQGSADLPTAVQAMERLLQPRSRRFAGLAKTLESAGLRGVEQQLAGAVLDLIITSKPHPVMRSFFGRLIDARNVLNMYKYLRLEEASPPPFFPGGTITEAQLRDAVAKENFFGISALVRDFFGIRIDAPDPTKVEISLSRAITRSLKKAGREPFGVAPMLDYLWRCSIEVMNLSVLMNTRDLERELAAAELVQ